MAVKLVFLLAAAPTLSNAERVLAVNRANPIRKVVTMLQSMQAKVTTEGEKEEALYHKFMCYCETSGSTLGASIDSANNKIGSLTSSLKSATERKEQTEADLKDHQASRSDAKAAMADATAVRNKEATAFAKVSADLDTNVGALSKAIAAVEKGMGGFLQTSTAHVVQHLALDSNNLGDAARQELLSFLSGTNSQGYAPASGEIVGILKQMKDEMAGDLKDAVNAEDAAIATYNGLMSAKKSEVAALSKQIETELQRVGDLGVEIAAMTNDLEDTQDGLAQDTEFKAGLASSCSTKTAEWEQVKKTRAEELLALAETIKVLNDDDALELFKKTLPSAAASSSFTQVQVSAASLRSRASALLQGKGVELDLISLALRGKKIGFEKVIKMIDSMVANLKTEQQDDDHKKEYCNSQFDMSDDKKKQLSLSISDSQVAIEDMTTSIAATSDEIAALEAGIRALDKSVAEATAQRKDDNAAFKELMANDAAAKEVLSWAKNRLNKFYNKALYKPAPKRDLSEEDRIVVNMGGTLAPTTVGGIAGTGIAASFFQTSSRREAPPPPPATGTYKKSSEGGRGVIAMIDLLVSDLDKEMTEAKTEETDSQSDYEKTMAEAAKKRAQDSKSITEKKSAKAAMEESVQSETEAKVGSEKEMAATLQYIHNLHGECDWLLKYFDVRNEARTGELQSLAKARDVLNGADYAM